MNLTESGTDRGAKVELIIETAQKRFGLYGLEKTSMREIADDLKLSKASLYYYFPDKENLYKAVVEKEQNEFIERISEKLVNLNDPGVLLQEYAVSRLSYFRTLLNLSRLRYEVYSDLKPVLRETIRLFKEKEKGIILKILESGIKQGIFTIRNPEETASLFLDLLKGLRITLVNDKITLFIDNEEFDKLLESTIAFTEIFINGLKTI